MFADIFKMSGSPSSYDVQQRARELMLEHETKQTKQRKKKNEDLDEIRRHVGSCLAVLNWLKNRWREGFDKWGGTGTLEQIRSLESLIRHISSL